MRTVQCQWLLIIQTVLIFHVDGTWTHWRQISIGTCWEKCEQKIVYKRRCASGAGTCPGKSYVTRAEACTVQRCIKVDGKWSRWNRETPNVEPCPSNCQRIVTYTRQCLKVNSSAKGKAMCPAKNSELRNETCTDGKCAKVDGKWSSWNTEIDNVNPCPSSCQQTVKYTRQCIKVNSTTGLPSCLGEVSELRIETCTDGKCVKVDGEWSRWSRETDDVEPCSSSCQRTVKYTRQCIKNNSVIGFPICPGKDSDLRDETCTGGKCVNVDGEWSRWNRETDDVEPCSSNCQRTVKYTRQCIKVNSDTGVPICPGTYNELRNETCTDGKCPKVDGKWSSWNRETDDVEPCSSSCQRTLKYTRQCINVNSTTGFLSCPGEVSELRIETCTDGKCVKANAWSAWKLVTIGMCGIHCQRSRLFKRSCPVADTCPGQNVKQRSETCRVDLCFKVPDEWSHWTMGTDAVGPCASNCQRTVKYTRQCLKLKPGTQFPSCPGKGIQLRNKTCTDGKCVKLKALQIFADDGLSPDSIVAIVFGCLVCFIATTLALLYHRLKRKRNIPPVTTAIKKYATRSIPYKHHKDEVKLDEILR